MKAKPKQSLLAALASTMGVKPTLLQEAVDAERIVHGDRHPNTLTSMGNLAAVLLNQGDLAGAEALHREVLAVEREDRGDKHPHTLVAIGNLAAVLKDKGDLQGAVALAREALEGSRAVLLASSTKVLCWISLLAVVALMVFG